MFAEERPALLPLPLEPFRYYQFGERTVHLDGCVEVDAAYYGAPPGWIGRQVKVAEDFSDVDLEISMDTNIASIAQKTNFPDIVLFAPIADPLGPGSVTTVDKDGKRITTPTIPMGITTAPVYRIRCNNIFSHSTVQLVVASVVLNNIVPGVEYHSAYAPKRQGRRI